MISFDEAQEIIKSNACSLPAFSQLYNLSSDYICASQVASTVAVSPFNNSAMDGFAVRASDLENSPVTLDVIGGTMAGDLPASGLGGAWEIMTGAQVPDGYDAVVKVEDVIIEELNANGRPARVTFSNPVDMGNNIRKAGEDFQPGDVVVRKGERITPAHIMSLAATGNKYIEVYSKPRVAVLSTGKEIVDDIEAELQPGQIWNSNGPYIMSYLSGRGVSAHYEGIFHDDHKIFEDHLEKMLHRSDIIISTGAVSAGRYDFIPDSLKKLGAEIKFHKVFIRPGKPILYAKFEGGPHYFGLPGNPVSAAIGLRFFVEPILKMLNGQVMERQLSAILHSTIDKSPKFRFFQKATAYLGDDSRLCVDILSGQESFKVHPLLKANCWAILPEGKEKIEAGSQINIVPLEPFKSVL